MYSSLQGPQTYVKCIERLSDKIYMHLKGEQEGEEVPSAPYMGVGHKGLTFGHTRGLTNSTQ